MSHECCEGSNKRVYCAFPGFTVKETLVVLLIYHIEPPTKFINNFPNSINKELFDFKENLELNASIISIISVSSVC